MRYSILSGREEEDLPPRKRPAPAHYVRTPQGDGDWALQADAALTAPPTAPAAASQFPMEFKVRRDELGRLIAMVSPEMEFQARRDELGRLIAMVSPSDGRRVAVSGRDELGRTSKLVASVEPPVSP